MLHTEHITHINKVITVETNDIEKYGLNPEMLS
jgi:hypothetical protein